MNDQYKYVGQSLTLKIARELIQELFAGQTVPKREIVRVVDETHLERGGLPAVSRSSYPVTRALAAMKQSGLAKNPRRGFWFILHYIKTLNGFLKWASQFDSEEDEEDAEKYLFRGVSSVDYKIDASAYRRLKKGRDSDERQDGDFERFLQINRDMIRDARFRGHDRRDGRRLEDLEILAEFQHYGAATCLIDFTYNVLVALWFACKKSSKDTSKGGKVVAVRPGDSTFTEITSGFSVITLESLEKKINDFFHDSKGNIKEKLYQWQPRHQNNRIIAQQSIFLFGVLDINPDAECIIDESSKEKIRKSLQRIYGITEDMLFPDFDGFAQQRSQDVPYILLPASEYRERAYREFQRGKYESAITDYDEAIHLNPDDASAYYQRGHVNFELQQYELAIDDYSKAIDRKPDDYADFYRARGNANFNLKRYAPAIEDYSEVIRIFPNDINSYNYRGLAKAAQKQYEEAIDDFDEAIRRSAGSHDIYRSRGWAKYELKQYKAAIDDYNEVIRIYDDRKSYYKRGLANFGLKKYELAIDDYDKAISLSTPFNMDPDDAYIYYQRALAKKELGRFEEEITDLQTAFPLAKRIANDDSELAVEIDYLLRELRSHSGESQ